MTEVTLDTIRFKELYEENFNLICNYLNSQTHDWELSQEIAQKTFVKLWMKKDRIHFSSSPKSYLFQSARNTLIDHFRAAKNLSTHSEQYAEQIETVSSVDTEADERSWDLKKKIAWAVQQLKPKTKEIFLLHKKEGLTYDEIADYMKISKRTVEYNMKNALIKLKELLKDKLD